MALVEKRICDVYGSHNKVETYRVALARKTQEGEWEPVRASESDLCPRALKRLEGFIKKGIRPPSERAGDENETEDKEAEPLAT